MIAEHQAGNADLFGAGFDMFQRHRRARALGQQDFAALGDILAKLKAETQAERDQQATLGKQVRDELKKIRDSRTKPGL